MLAVHASLRLAELGKGPGYFVLTRRDCGGCGGVDLRTTTRGLVLGQEITGEKFVDGVQFALVLPRRVEDVPLCFGRLPEQIDLAVDRVVPLGHDLASSGFGLRHQERTLPLKPAHLLQPALVFAHRVDAVQDGAGRVAVGLLDGFQSCALCGRAVVGLTLGVDDCGGGGGGLLRAGFQPAAAQLFLAHDEVGVLNLQPAQFSGFLARALDGLRELATDPAGAVNRVPLGRNYRSLLPQCEDLRLHLPAVASDLGKLLLWVHRLKSALRLNASDLLRRLNRGALDVVHLGRELRQRFNRRVDCPDQRNPKCRSQARAERLRIEDPLHERGRRRAGLLQLREAVLDVQERLPRGVDRPDRE